MTLAEVVVIPQQEEIVVSREVLHPITTPPKLSLLIITPQRISRQQLMPQNLNNLQIHTISQTQLRKITSQIQRTQITQDKMLKLLFRLKTQVL